MIQHILQQIFYCHTSLKLFKLKDPVAPMLLKHLIILIGFIDNI